MRIDMKVKFKEPATVYSLVLGGWSPLALTSASIHIIDRNILIWLRKSLSNGYRRDDYQANEWWLKFLDAPTQSINPICCALEGGQKRTPTLQEFEEEYLRAADELKFYFPKAKIIHQPENDFKSTYQIVSNLQNRQSKEIDFLCSVSGLIAEKVPKEKISKISDKILSDAESRKLKSPVVLIAALSCLYGSDHARKLIKPSKSYNEGDAYNALADIHSLEMLASATSLGQEVIGFCTRDKPLSAFWCQLGVNKSAWVNDLCKLSLSLSQDIFPGLPLEGQQKLISSAVSSGLIE